MAGDGGDVMAGRAALVPRLLSKEGVMDRLRWIQRYYGGSAKLPPPMCEFLDQRAVGMWVDPDGHAHDLCATHATRFNAPPMEEGICYAPTHT